MELHRVDLSILGEQIVKVCEGGVGILRLQIFYVQIGAKRQRFDSHLMAKRNIVILDLCVVE